MPCAARGIACERNAPCPARAACTHQQLRVRDPSEVRGPRNARDGNERRVERGREPVAGKPLRNCARRRHVLVSTAAVPRHGACVPCGVAATPAGGAGGGADTAAAAPAAASVARASAMPATSSAARVAAAAARAAYVAAARTPGLTRRDRRHTHAGTQSHAATLQCSSKHESHHNQTPSSPYVLHHATPRVHSDTLTQGT